MADVYLYYAHQFAEEKNFEKSKDYLNLAVTFLEEISEICDKDGLNDFKQNSLNCVLLDTNDLLNEKLSYPTEEWKSRIQVLIQNLEG